MVSTSGGPPADRGETAKGESDRASKTQREIIELIKQRLPEGHVERHELAEILAEIVTVEIRQLIRFQGPLPPPEMLAEYESTLPGLAEKIVSRADKEQDFRHEATRYEQETEQKVLRYQAAKTYLG